MSESRQELKDFILTSLNNNLSEISESVEQPASILTSLRPHQLTLLAAARALEKRSSLKEFCLDSPMLVTKYGIIADRVGSGKSLVALSLVNDPPPEQTRVIVRQGNHYGDAVTLSLNQLQPVKENVDVLKDLSGSNILDLIKSADGRIYVRTALCIVPHNVCPQWESYIKEQTSLKTVIVKRTKDCERPAWDLFSADLILISSTMLKKFISTYSNFSSIVWSRLFVDEADSIQCTVRHGEIQARFTWFISASWVNMLFPAGIHSYSMHNLPDDLKARLGNGHVDGIQSRYGFIYNTLSDTRYAEFTRLLIRNSEAWIDVSLKRPVIVHDTIMCKTPANLNILRGFISPAAMEALHAGDTAGALEALGLKAATKETLVDRVTASLRGDLLQAERLLEFKKTMDYSTPAIKELALEKADQKVNRLRGQLESLEARVKGASQDMCPICVDVPRTPTLTPCCRHCFCLSCLCECMTSKPACPLCRAPIHSVSELLVVGEGVDTSHAEPNILPTKGAALLDLLQNSNEDQRFLVFSAHEASFKGLRELLSARGIRCELLSGSGARVERLRKQFEEGTIRVLCMNARHVGAGINLEAATHVVLYHRMNTELEKQVIGRAVRFEREKELRIVHLVHDGETAITGEQGSEVIMHV